MIYIRQGLGLLLIACLLALEPNVVQATPRAVVLRGLNTFTTSSPAWILVRLSRATAVPKDLNITYEGNGRVQGYVMIKQGMPIDEAPTLESKTIGQCSTQGCRSVGADDIVTSGTNFGRKLPAGIYRLYIIADHAPVTVTITMDGVRGTTSAHPSYPYALDVRTLAPRSDLTPGHNVFSAGDFRAAAPEPAQIAFIGLWLSGPTETVGAAGDCLYPDRNEHPALAFAPGCPDGESSGPWLLAGSDSNGHLIAKTTDWGNPAGIGVWFATASLIESYGAVGFWMTL